MNHGMVMELAGGMAVVMTTEGQFLRVRAAGRDIQVGQEIDWTADDIVDSRREFRTARVRRAARFGAYAAAVMILVVAAVLWSFRDPVVVAYVSMDVNPSIEMGLDSHERVRELRAVNQDAADLVAGVAYRGKLVEQVASMLAVNMAGSDLLREDAGEIVIASVRLGSVDEQWEARVTDKIKQSLVQAAAAANQAADAGAAMKTEPALTFETVFLPVEVRNEAEEQGISSGKMAFYLAAERSGHEVDLKALQANSVQEIASSMGGLKQVMDADAIAKKDQEAWKKLLDDAKQSDKQLQENKRQTSGSARPESSQNAGKNSGKGNGTVKDKSSPKDGEKVKDKNNDKNNDKEKKDKEQNKINDKQKSNEKDKEKDGGNGKGRSGYDRGGRSNGKDNSQANKDNGKNNGNNNVRDNDRWNDKSNGNSNGKSDEKGNGKDNGRNKGQDNVNGRKEDGKGNRGNNEGKQTGRGQDNSHGSSRGRGNDR